MSLRPLESLAEDADEAEMREMVACMRIEMAGKLLAEGDFPSAKVAYSSALLICDGEQADEARRGLEQSLKGLRLHSAPAERLSTVSVEDGGGVVRQR